MQKSVCGSRIKDFGDDYSKIKDPSQSELLNIEPGSCNSRRRTVD